MTCFRKYTFGLVLILFRVVDSGRYLSQFEWLRIIFSNHFTPGFSKETKWNMGSEICSRIQGKVQIASPWSWLNTTVSVPEIGKITQINKGWIDISVPFKGNSAPWQLSCHFWSIFVLNIMGFFFISVHFNFSWYFFSIQATIFNQMFFKALLQAINYFR